MPTTSTPRETTRGRRRSFDRQQALDVAMAMFWEDGYEATSVSRLCTGIGINPPSLYAAFGSKAQLFLEVVDRYERSVWDPLWEAFDREPELQTAFRQFFDHFVDVISKPGPHLGCLVVQSAVGLRDRESVVARALTDIGEQGVHRFEAKLDVGVRDGRLPASTDTNALAHAVNMLSTGLALQAHDGVPPALLRRQAAVGLQMIPVEPVSSSETGQPRRPAP